MRIIFLLSLCISLLLETGFAEALPESCLQNCTNNFGEELGKSMSGVKAFSNCNNSCVNPKPFFINKTFTGIQWQCVEYARRWLLENKNVVYGDVDIAADIWRLEYVTDASGETKNMFQGFVNGSKEFWPERGDLLIYSQEFFGTGHVAVVLKVDEQKVYVGEQNYDNSMWPGDYAREIPYLKYKEGFWLLDPYIIGWKRVIVE